MRIPSFDFSLFELPFFSSLQAQEFGASTSFNANDPIGYIDFSLNRLLGLTEPNNPRPYAQRQFPVDFTELSPFEFFQQKPDIIQVFPQGTLPPELQGKGAQETKPRKNQGCNIFDMITDPFGCMTGTAGSGPIIDDKEMKSTDDEGMAKSTFGEGLGNYLKSLPKGSGIFLIAIVIIILLLLFVRK